jgi:VCBS repeat-containing protein
MSKPAAKGNPKNTNGGTEISLTKTPQAKDDLLGSGSDRIDFQNAIYYLDVMANDLAGKAKSLWSVDDGINDSGAMDGYEAGDLLTEDEPGVTGLTDNKSLFGAAIWITTDGKVAYDAGSINGQVAADLTELALGDTLTDSFIYAIRMANGTLSWAKASVVLTGVNDAPTVQAVSIAAIEDGDAVTGTFQGDDVDADNDINDLTYEIIGAPDAGSLVNNGDGTFTFNPGTDFQTLAKNETATITLSYTATDRHGAVSDPAALTITVTGENDAPEMAAGTGTADEDGAAITVDLAVLGSDVDSDNDGGSLIYSVTGSPAEGSASVSGTNLIFDPGLDFQDLAEGETRDVTVQITAKDKWGATVSNDVIITVTGTNDAPVFTGGNTDSTITMNPVQAPFTVEQWTGYDSDILANLQNYASNHSPNHTVTTNVIDFTDDPNGFAGEIPGSTPWPAAQADGATGTGGINDNFFARVTSNILITEADTYTFRTFNDDGVFLSVNNQQIISNSGYFPETAFEGSITLDPGVYPLELYFYEGGGEASLELTYKNSSGIYQHVGNGPLNATGTLTFDDVDLSDAHTITTTPASADTVGTLTATLAADTTGSGTGGQVSWSYELGGSEQLQLQSLAAGETAVQEFTVTIDDGKGGTDTQTVSVTIEGVNDPAVLGNAVANLTETDEQLTTSGTLSITDVDNDEAFFNTQTNTPGDYGSFSIDADGNWSFASNGALDELEDGDVVTDIFNVTSVDGTATTVTVNITGTADGPTATDDSAALTASAVNNSSDNTVYWVDWISATVDSQVGGRNPTYTVQGTITLSDRTIDVTYHGQAAEPWGAVPGVQLSGGTDYFVTGKHPQHHQHGRRRRIYQPRSWQWADQ